MEKFKKYLLLVMTLVIGFNLSGADKRRTCDEALENFKNNIALRAAALPANERQGFISKELFHYGLKEQRAMMREKFQEEKQVSRYCFWKPGLEWAVMYVARKNSEIGQKAGKKIEEYNGAQKKNDEANTKGHLDYVERCKKNNRWEKKDGYWTNCDQSYRSNSLFQLNKKNFFIVGAGLIAFSIGYAVTAYKIAQESAVQVAKVLAPESGATEAARFIAVVNSHTIQRYLSTSSTMQSGVRGFGALLFGLAYSPNLRLNEFYYNEKPLFDSREIGVLLKAGTYGIVAGVTTGLLGTAYLKYQLLK